MDMNRRTLAIAGAVLAVAIAAGGYAWTKQRGAVPAPAAGYQNDKRLVVSGWTRDELDQIVGEFTVLYRSQLPPDFSYEVRSAGALQQVTFAHDMPPWTFLYLVNYAQYPKGRDLSGRSIRAAGLTTLSPDFELPAQGLYGRKATFYVPANDTTFDTVYGRAGADAFEISFASGEWKSVSDPRAPDDLAKVTGP